MKTYLLNKIPALCLFAFLVVLLSCNKSNSGSSPLDEDSIASYTTFRGGASNVVPVSFCATDTVALFFKASNQVVSNMYLKRGSDGSLHVTFKAPSNFYFKQINLYCGAPEGIPLLLANFPYKIIYSQPFPSNEHTFIINGLPESFTVVAYTNVVKKAANGNVTADVKAGWAHLGNEHPSLCSLIKTLGLGMVCGDLTEGSYFNYTSNTSCFSLDRLVLEEPDICSRPVDHFFGISATCNCKSPWSEAAVTVGGSTYTESEARAIAETTDADGTAPDSKYAFMRVATLKLSYTDYMASPTLGPAVTTVENWLATKSKLSPAYLPDATQEVRDASAVIDRFIEAHPCPDRR
jgi:hypothetical protein